MDDVLRALPVAAFLILCVAGCDGLDEPFAEFSVRNALLQIGGPLVVFGIWASWLTLAIRRRLPWHWFAVVSCWAAFNMCVAAMVLASYLDEPWNG